MAPEGRSQGAGLASSLGTESLASALPGWGAPEIQVLLGWGLGLAKSQSPQTQEVAFQLAQNWIRTNFDVYSQKSTMYEKVS